MKKYLAMMQSLSFIILLIGSLFSVNVYSQSWVWARQPKFVGNPPTQSDGEGYSVATDNAGNVYQTGFYAYAYMYYGNDTIGAINGDAFLVKYNSSGVVQWATQPHLQNIYSEAEASFVTTDASGNVYITGFFTDSVSFGSFTLGSVGNAGEVFLVKYDANGNVKWARQSHASGFNGNYNLGLGVSADPSGNIYITGQFQNTTTFGAFSLSNPAGAANQFGTQGSVFLVKYDTNGNVLWARQGAIPSNTCFNNARAVATDAFNNVFITGAFHDTVSFGSQTLITNSIVGEIFVTKYDQNGNVLWARQTVNNSTQYWGNGPIFGNALATDKHGSVYVAGNFEDTINFGSTQLISPISFANYAFPYGDMFLAKYDGSGNISWAKAGFPLTNGAYAGWAVATDTFDHVYFDAGGWNVYSSAKLTFSVQFGNETFTATGLPSIEASTILKLDTGGNVLCGVEIPFGGDDNTGIAVDPTGTYVYVGGDFYVQNDIVIGPDTLSTEGNPENMGVEIPYVLRWQPCVEALPLSLSFIDSNATCHGLCNGMITANPSGGNPPYTYLWNTNPADTSKTITALCAANYSVTVTDHSGGTITSGITITQPDSTPVVISATANSICAGDSAHLLASGNATSIQWQSSVDGILFTDISGDTASVNNFADVTQTTYYRVIASGNCNYDSSSVVKLLVNALPVPVLSTSDSIICSNDSTQICTSDTFVSYVWNIIGDTSYCITARQAGGYWVTVTDANGCSAVSNHQGISVFPVPIVAFTRHGDTLASFNSFAYQWLLNDTIIAGATDSVYIANVTGNYAVQITDTNGCVVSSVNTLIVISGITGLDNNRSLTVYPDPFNNVIFIKQNNTGDFIGGIDLYNVLGEKIISKRLNSFSVMQFSFDVSTLPPGLYYVIVKTNNSDYLKKMVKE